MQKLLITAGVMLFSLMGATQTIESMVLKVEYQFIHVQDKKKADTLHNENLILRIGKNSSAYGTIPFEAALQKREEVAPPPAGGATRVVQGLPMAVVHDFGLTNETIYVEPVSKKLNIMSSVGIADYLIEESLPQIAWTVNENTKVIGGYTCQQAVGKYAGRTYTAWFATDLPFNAGPWKLTGLPGLILEAEDDKSEVFFRFLRLSNAQSGEITAPELRKEPVKVTWAALKKAREGFEQNPVAVVQAQAGVSSKLSMRFKDRKGVFHSGEQAEKLLEEKRKQVLSNPLELTK